MSSFSPQLSVLKSSASGTNKKKKTEELQNTNKNVEKPDSKRQLTWAIEGKKLTQIFGVFIEYRY